MSSRQEEDQLVYEVRARAHDPAMRTDLSSVRRRDLPAPATAAQLDAAEAMMGFPMHPLHRRLLQEIADGGFGPGDGLVGVVNGKDAHDRALVELRDALWIDSETPLYPGVVPLCDWGDAIWSCIDAKTGHVLTLDESGLTDTQQSLCSWLADWISGVQIFGKMFVFEERTMVNPFTKQLIVVRAPARPIGTPYRPSE